MFFGFFSAAGTPRLRRSRLQCCAWGGHAAAAAAASPTGTGMKGRGAAAAAASGEEKTKNKKKQKQNGGLRGANGTAAWELPARECHWQCQWLQHHGCQWVNPAGALRFNEVLPTVVTSPAARRPGGPAVGPCAMLR